MENQKLVFYTCLIVSLLGVSLISFADGPAKATDITESEIGHYVSYSGTIDSKYGSGGHTFLSVNGTKVAIFEKTKTSSSPRYLFVGDHVTVTGVVELYEGELEIVAEDIELC